MTKPTMPFPQSMQPLFSGIHNGGTSVNGAPAGPSLVIKPGEKPY